MAYGSKKEFRQAIEGMRLHGRSYGCMSQIFNRFVTTKLQESGVMSSVAERAIAAIVGCIVSDAAAQPLHWIYNLKKLDSIVGSQKDSVEFWVPSMNPFYCIETGRGTAYADQLQALLESLVKAKGYNKDTFADKLQTVFGPGTEYDNILNGSYVMKSGVQKKYPIKGPWRPEVMKDFLANRANGLDNTGSKVMQDMHAVVAVTPVVALYAGKKDMLEKVESSISVVTQVEEAIVIGLAAARILEQFILNAGMNGEEAIEAVMKELANPSRNNPNDLDRAVIGMLKKVLDKRMLDHREVAQNIFKNSCDIPGAFQSALHGLVNHNDLASAVRSTIMAGGCNSSRSGFIGACLGARNGLEGIPEMWKAKTLSFARILDLSNNLASLQLDD